MIKTRIKEPVLASATFTGENRSVWQMVVTETTIARKVYLIRSDMVKRHTLVCYFLEIKQS